MSRTVYINDYPIGETEVYHERKGHATKRRRWLDRHVREATVEEARDEGLRPCRVCFPVDEAACCPSCGHEGGGDEALAPGQRWCSVDECRVVTFYEEARAERSAD